MDVFFWRRSAREIDLFASFHFSINTKKKKKKRKIYWNRSWRDRVAKKLNSWKLTTINWRWMDFVRKDPFVFVYGREVKKVAWNLKFHILVLFFFSYKYRREGGILFWSWRARWFEKCFQLVRACVFGPRFDRADRACIPTFSFFVEHVFLWTCSN